MPNTIHNLLDNALKFAGLTVDSRFSYWVKYVDDVKEKEPGVYAFPGEFVQSGTVLLRDKPAVLLCHVTNGSRPNRTKYYKFIVIKPDGSFEDPQIADNDSCKGWHLRVMPKVQALLQSLNLGPMQMTGDLATDITVDFSPPSLKKQQEDSLGYMTDEMLITELEKRGYTCIKQTPSVTNTVVIQYSFDADCYTLYKNGDPWCSFRDHKIEFELRKQAERSNDIHEFYIRTFRLEIEQE